MPPSSARWTGDELPTWVDTLIGESRFSGVVRIDQAGETVLERAAGWAHRAHRAPMTVDTRLAVASGSKAFTALVILSLAADGTLPLTTRARDLLGDDLPLVDDRVTVEHLLAHRSGIGDYLDENAGHQITDYVMPVPVHTLADSNDYLTVLDGHPQSFAPGERFAYNNAGFVVLAILAERATGDAFVDLVQQRVCRPAGLTDTAYLRSDQLPERTALGYLHADGHRSNVLHLPVRGSGDGGAYTTAADIHRLWTALRQGVVLDQAALTAAWQPRSDVPSESSRYGLGFWLHATGEALRRRKPIVNREDAVADGRPGRAVSDRHPNWSMRAPGRPAPVRERRVIDGIGSFAMSVVDVMELERAMVAVRATHQSVLTTIRGSDGLPQLSNVGHMVGPDGVIPVSTTADRAKYANLRRRPWAALKVDVGTFWSYVVVEGPVELSAVAAAPDDPAVEELIEVYRAIGGEHPDWDDYRRAMVTDRRLVIRMRPDRAYGLLR
jgi:PPOX class probable F420-dependent enzyme